MPSKLKKFREDRNMSVAEFAKAIGMSPDVCYKVESGERTASKLFMSNMKKRFPEIDIDYIFFDVIMDETSKDK